MERINMPGVLQNAGNELAELCQKIRALEEWDEDSEKDDPGWTADYYASALKEMTNHAAAVARGERSLEEFADFYCLKKL